MLALDSDTMRTTCWYPALTTPSSRNKRHDTCGCRARKSAKRYLPATSVLTRRGLFRRHVEWNAHANCVTSTRRDPTPSRRGPTNIGGLGFESPPLRHNDAGRHAHLGIAQHQAGRLDQRCERLHERYRAEPRARVRKQDMWIDNVPHSRRSRHWRWWRPSCTVSSARLRADRNASTSTRICATADA